MRLQHPLGKLLPYADRIGSTINVLVSSVADKNKRIQICIQTWRRAEVCGSPEMANGRAMAEGVPTLDLKPVVLVAFTGANGAGTADADGESGSDDRVGRLC